MRPSLNRNRLLTVRLDTASFRRVVNLQIEAIEKNVVMLMSTSSVVYFTLRRALERGEDEIVARVTNLQHSWLKHITTTRTDEETLERLKYIAQRLGMEGKVSFVASRLIIAELQTTTLDDLIRQAKRELFPEA